MEETLKKLVIVDDATFAEAMEDIENSLKAAYQAQRTRTIRDSLARVKAFNFCLRRELEKGYSLLTGVDDAIIENLKTVLETLCKHRELDAAARGRCLDAMTHLEA